MSAGLRSLANPYGFPTEVKPLLIPGRLRSEGEKFTLSFQKDFLELHCLGIFLRDHG